MCDGISFVVEKEQFDRAGIIVDFLKEAYGDVNILEYSPSLGSELENRIVFLQASADKGDALFNDLRGRHAALAILYDAPSISECRRYLHNWAMDYLAFSMGSMDEYLSLIDALMMQ